ncbi:extracellular solute-binding protein [Paenibacillus spongiae]|uniref:Extracellular solute-binding protein n=1 Tax=Paenibacillus spongiae TaxID=2909671 RepID=A0ABY5SL14_9BACL|nr:extracellular solute-binding protein [Paenibacillus spongiae]UVI33372.1 extracellular solute-binding protein [Paenibacillus spongiae]
MKKLGIKKWVSLCIVIPLCLFSLAACSSNDDKGKQTEQASQDGKGNQTEQAAQDGKGNQTEQAAQDDKKLEDYTEEMKITAYQGANYGGPSNSSATEYAKYVKQKFKINVDDFVWPAGEEVKKKLSLFAASGEMPDIVQSTSDPATLQILNQMSDAGMLLDIEPYLSKSPNVMKYLTKPIIDSYRNPNDGKLYVLPGFTINPELKDELTIAVNNVLMVREDWLKKLNLDVPQTPDEFYEVLKAFKTMPAVNGKKVIPYLPLWEGNEINTHIGAMFGIWQYRTAVDENAQKMVDAHEKPEYLEYLKYASKLFREGLVTRKPIR